MKKLAMYVFIDALGWEIYERYGFLKEMALNERKLRTTFGFSSAADPSILSGRYVLYTIPKTHLSGVCRSWQNSPVSYLIAGECDTTSAN